MHKLLGDVTENIIALRIQTSLSPPRPHGLGVGDAWHFRLPACSAFTFVEISWPGFSPPENKINKPASNKRRVFLAAVFHFKAAVEEHEYRIYSINRPGRLLNFWTLRVGAYSRLGAY